MEGKKVKTKGEYSSFIWKMFQLQSNVDVGEPEVNLGSATY